MVYGCFSNEDAGGVVQGSNSIASLSGADGIAFSASKSNSIYGASDTVMVDSYNQPVAIYLGS